MAHSLSYYKFIRFSEEEIRTYWGLSTMREFGERYLSQLENRSIVELGGSTQPFTYIDIPKNDLVKYSKGWIEHARENAILNIITALEVYFYDILSRVSFLHPDILSQSEKQWKTAEIVKNINGNFKKWFVEEAVSKTIRNRQHKDIVKFIFRTIKWDSKIDDKLELWNKFTYVRNCIAHNSRKTTRDLCNEWPERYPHIGTSLKITNGDLMQVVRLSQQIAKSIEMPVMKDYIKDSDALLLCREIFVREGIDEISQLKQIAYNNLSQKLTNVSIQQAIAYQKRTNEQPLEEFDFDSIYQYLTR